MSQDQTTFDPVVIEGPDRTAPVLVLCEHASAVFPPTFGNLGLAKAVRQSHVAWDPGALAVARRLAAALDAPLVAGGVSRLLYDCNRPPDAPDAVPAKSEIYDIPGNCGLSEQARQARVDAIYRPFSAAVGAALDRAAPGALITVHSFTPIFNGQPRAVEIGVLHDADARLADALLAQLAGAGALVQRNAPYGPEDGVTHSLKTHALPRGMLNVMLEIRNDLIADAPGIARVCDLLLPALRAALVRAQSEGAR